MPLGTPISQQNFRNLKIQDGGGAILKSRTITISRNGLTDFDKICTMMHLAPWTLPANKMWEFYIFKMATAPFWKKMKNRSNPAVDWPILRKFGTVMHLGSQDAISQYTFQNPRRWTSPSWKIKKLWSEKPFYRFWQNMVRWSISAPSASRQSK